jgi:hypothetical protein
MHPTACCRTECRNRLIPHFLQLLTLAKKFSYAHYVYFAAYRML